MNEAYVTKPQAEETDPAEQVGTKTNRRSMSVTGKLLLILGLFISIITCSSLFVFGMTHFIDEKLVKLLDGLQSVQDTAGKALTANAMGVFQLDHFLNWVVGAGGAVSIVLGIAFFIHVRRIFRPFATIIETLRRVSQGDLTVEVIQVRNRDEIGELARCLNELTENFRTVIEQAQTASQEVAAVSEQLSASADETSKAAERVAQSISEATAGAQTQLRTAQNSVSGIQEMLHDLQRVADIVSGVSEVAVSVRNEAERGNGIMGSAGSQMKVIQVSVSTSHQLVEALNESSKKIGSIADVIREISEQTSLLSLNAAIEASRAGDTGKGFVVVADEIRRLAEQSRSSTREIEGLIQTMRDSIKQVVESMSVIASEVTSGAEALERAEASFSDIYEATVQMAEQLRDNTGIVQELAAKSENISKMVVHTSEIASESAALFQEVAAAAEEQLAAMNEILATSTSLNRLAGQLQSRIQHFRIGRE
ncbi:MAG: methyl-accepting chemotaxis protein [Alicyclobacillus sp.]|nr:methyl-accepting chemotaxis protein [Alicyclobacillus sp.]